MALDPLTPQQFLKDQSYIDSYLTWPWALLLASIALGFVTMTLSEGLKPNSRYRFAQRELADWLNGNYSYAGQERHWLLAALRRWWKMVLRIFVTWPREQENSEQIRYLVLFSTAGNKQALFSLPLENLCGQLALGIQAILDSSDVRPNLIKALIGPGFELPGIRQHFDRYTDLRADRKVSNELEDNFIESRSIIATMIQRNIDSFQILASYRWKRFQRERAFFMSLVVASLGSMLFAAGRHLLSSVFVIVFLSYTGTFFAVFIGDIVDILRRRADAL